MIADGDHEEGGGGDESEDNLSSKNINNRSAHKMLGSSKSNNRYRKKSGRALGSKSNKRKDETSNQREDEKQDYRSGGALDVSSVQDIEQDQRPGGSSMSDEEEVKGEDNLIVKEEENDRSLNVSKQQYNRYETGEIPDEDMDETMG